MRIQYLVLCLFSPLLSSCTAGNADQTSGTPFVNVPYVVVSQGIQQSIKNQELHVVTDATQLAALAATAVFSPPLPALDLAANDLVAIFLPTRTACDRLGILNGSASPHVGLVALENTCPVHHKPRVSPVS